MGTILECTSRCTLLAHLGDDTSTSAITAGVVMTLRRLPEHMRIRTTWDRGIEMADHADVSVLNISVFFWDPASPWRRDTNENTNGLLEWPPAPAPPQGHPAVSPHPERPASYPEGTKQPNQKVPERTNPIRGLSQTF